MADAKKYHSPAFVESYKRIKPSLVAIVSKVSRNPEFPDILGTGFVVRKEGLILTNNHVVRAIPRLPRLKTSSEEEWPAYAVIFHNVEGVGMSYAAMSIKGAFAVSIDPPPMYGPRTPDVGFLRVPFKDLPEAELEESPHYEEGQEVGIAGFPMGTELLKAPGKLHQVNPTLRKGIIGAILPFPCKNPHALMLDILTQSGSSGSPVFNPETGKVIGVLYGGIEEPKVIDGGEHGILIYKNPTGISYAVPSHFFAELLRKIDKDNEWRKHDIGEIKSLNELLKEGLEKYQKGELKNGLVSVGANEVLFKRKT